MEDNLIHYGTPRHSGRYKWGSGQDPYQHSGDFLSRVEELSKQGMSEKDIASTMGLTTTQLRIQKSLANVERRSIDVETAKGLRDKGYSLATIAEKMGYANDSSVRTLLDPNAEERMKQATHTADFLKKQVDEKGMIDVGSGIERELNVSKEKLSQALYMLEMQGYPTYGGGISQATNKGQQTNLKVLCPPGTEHKEIYNFDNIKSIGNYISRDGGNTFETFKYPSSLDSKRLQVVYGNQGGVDKDGVIELRRGVKDLSLGNSNYAQVRIMVDGSHYLKGMAVYADDLPEGVDVRFNTNKNDNVPVLGSKNNTILKTIKSDPDNPFGSLIKAGGQSYYDDPKGDHIDPETGKKQSLSLINKRAEEGDWTEWKKKLPSQFLAKQNLSLINKQLDATKNERQAEFDEIKALTNPTIKKALLKSFADDCDSAAVHLKSAALPRQRYNVILPINSLKDNEVYAPNYENGEKLALVRFPHGGTFEIPVLTVNNKNKDGQNTIGINAQDAVGITSKVAERLSGADFDGDTVLTIPTGRGGVNITSTNPLKGLEGFDSKSYKYAKSKTDKDGNEHYYTADGTEFRRMKNTQTEMGKISNLITDMTIKGASEDELAKAVRHSMVVIDAEKHILNYKQSEVDNNIKELKNKYQGHYDEQGKWHSGGASTLLSRAKSEQQVVKRKGSPHIEDDGSLTYKTDYQEYTDKNGKTKVRTQKSTKMMETPDARTLSSGTRPEEAYADYANKMKAMANEARKEMITTGKIQYSAKAKAQYINEVKSLDAKLNVSLKNAPKERRAQIIANTIIKSKKETYPDMTKGELKKISQQALTAARAQVGAKRELIKISDKEWEAIQAGAISENKLQQIINNSDMDVLRQKATPKATTQLSQVKINKINAMAMSGYTTAEIAKSLGVSSSTIVNYMKGGLD
jgi:predicted transcriptional regulator